VALAKDDLHKLGGGQLEMKTISFARTAALLNAGEIVIATVPWAEEFTHHEVLRRARASTPCPASRSVSQSGGGTSDDDDWVLDPGTGSPRASRRHQAEAWALHLRRA
jgi:hypothetical protein